MHDTILPSLPPTLIDKYNVPVPRYTSYPPANLFHTGYTSADMIDDVVASNSVGRSDLSFYIHIPFCKRICSYCACNKELFPSAKEGVATYIEHLLREFDILRRHIDPSRKISQIHFGGGSPTAIPLIHIEQILTAITSAFELNADAEVAIECHPGYLGDEEWDYLLRLPFTRYSVGVQDFDSVVLKNVKRTPSRLPVDEIVRRIHDAGKRVNLDFIYGLPGQDVDSFRATMVQAFACVPDRLVTFSYAHVPWLHEIQKELELLGLPDMTSKKAMYDVAASEALRNGYEIIGLDHFVRSDDPLSIARGEHLLHRNFQGYCTITTSGQVYALGVTGISQLEGSYAQNIKTISEYCDAVNRGELPTHIGYRLSDDERLARDIINDLMCNYRTSPLAIAHRHGHKVDELSALSILKYEALRQMIQDGLCLVEGKDTLVVPRSAHLFVRNVASLFDIHYNPDKTTGYSKPI